MIITSLLISLHSKIPEVTTVEVPVFKLNFYLMGMNEVDEEVTVRIGENVEYLNEEFEGMIKFELDKLVMDPNHAYIPDLHRDHIRRNRNKVNRLLRPVESSGAINIYLFETYSKDDQDMAMMGFTPVLSKRPGEYEHSSPPI